MFAVRRTIYKIKMVEFAAKKSRREFYMKITILGSGCSKCRALYATVESALKKEI